jgi:hypothetical protein
MFALLPTLIRQKADCAIVGEGLLFIGPTALAPTRGTAVITVLLHEDWIRSSAGNYLTRHPPERYRTSNY